MILENLDNNKHYECSEAEASRISKIPKSTLYKKRKEAEPTPHFEKTRTIIIDCWKFTWRNVNQVKQKKGFAIHPENTHKSLLSNKQL